MTISHEWFTWECPYCSELDVTIGEPQARREVAGHVRTTTDDAHDEAEECPDGFDRRTDAVVPFPRYSPASRR